jgi:hypothetical protein
MPEQWLVFVDTNIMLDFYRMPGENAGRQIDSLKKHLNSIIVTEQVKMEFMKHRQKVISDMMAQMAAPQKAALPMILTGSRAGKALSKAMEQAVKRHKEAKQRVELILADPGRFDPVYRGLSALFSHNARSILSGQTRRGTKSESRPWNVFGLAILPGNQGTRR